MKFQLRESNENYQEGLVHGDPVLNRIFRSRGVQSPDELKYDLNKLLPPNFKDMDARTVTDKDIVAARAAKYNGVRFLNAAVPYELYRMCDSLGMYVSVAVPINTRNSGASRRVGGNESNNREWRESFVQRAENSFYTTRNYACVVEYTLANESSNGINLYESYLRLKELVTKHPVIYSDGGGEWNSDK